MQTQMDGFPAKHCSQPALGEIVRHVQSFTDWSASSGSSSTVLSLLLMQLTPSDGLVAPWLIQEAWQSLHMLVEVRLESCGHFPSFISNHFTPWSLQSKQLSDLEDSHDVRRSKYHSAAIIILIHFWPAILAKCGNHPMFMGDSKSIMSMCNLRSALRDSPRELHGGRNSLLATHQYCKSIRRTYSSVGQMESYAPAIKLLNWTPAYWSVQLHFITMLVVFDVPFFHSPLWKLHIL